MTDRPSMQGMPTYRCEIGGDVAGDQPPVCRQRQRHAKCGIACEDADLNDGLRCCQPRQHLQDRYAVWRRAHADARVLQCHLRWTSTHQAESSLCRWKAVPRPHHAPNGGTDAYPLQLLQVCVRPQAVLHHVLPHWAAPFGRGNILRCSHAVECALPSPMQAVLRLLSGSCKRWC